MTNNPAQYHWLSGHGIRIVAGEPLSIPPNTDNTATSPPSAFACGMRSRGERL